MRFTPNLVVGVALTLLGSALLLDRLGVVTATALLSYWPVMLMLFGAAVTTQALSGEPAEGPSGRQRPMFGSGFVLIWVLVWLAVSAGQGQRFVAAGTAGDPELRLVGILGRDVRTSGTTAFRGAAMTTVMGMTRLDLRRTTMAGTQATVDVLGVMGGVEVVVPPGWVVDVQTTSVMGGVRDRRSERPPDDSAAPRLVLRGVIVAGGLTIQS